MPGNAVSSVGFLWGIAAAGTDLWGFCGDARRPVSHRGGTWTCPPAHIVDAGVAMPEQTTGGADAEPALRSLADKVNWLIDRARPAGRGSCSNAEVADLIERTTGQRVSYTTIWKLQNGQAANPQMKLIEAMARTFGVRDSSSLTTTRTRPGCCKRRWSCWPWSAAPASALLSSARSWG